MSKLHIILTCDGGNGHKAAAEAIKMQAIAANDTAVVINTTHSGWISAPGLNISSDYDRLFYKGLTDLGPSTVIWWDWAQRTSNTELLRLFVSMRKISLLSVPAFRHRSYELLTNIENIDSYSEVIVHNTQPICLQALVFSVARYNREIKAHNQSNPDSPRKTVKYINHLTDLPTLQSKMAMEELSRVDVADLNDAEFELYTRPPMIHRHHLATDVPSQIELEYHKKAKRLYPNLYCDLPSNTSRVKFVDGPIRAPFLFRKYNPAKREDGLLIQFKDPAEFHALNQTLSHAMGDFDPSTRYAPLPLAEDIEIVSLMLGSQASIEGTLSLVQEEIKFALGSKKTKYLFVFCGENRPAEGLSLYGKVLEIAQQINGVPETRIHIIPLANQSGSMIADLYSLADRIITRPGGISIMEIEAVAQRSNVFIFTELSQLEKSFNKLLSRSFETLQEQFSQQKSQTRFSDLVAWEAGNALHAQHVCRDKSGRTRVLPVNIYTYCHELAFINKKESVTELLSNQQYVEAIDELITTPALNAFFLTGDDEGGALACLVEFIQLYRQTGKKLSDLIQKHHGLQTLEKGPICTFDLMTKAEKTIFSRLNQHESPSIIVKEVLSQIAQIKFSLDESIEAVKQSNIENKHVILRALEFLLRAVSNFFRFIFRLSPNYEPMDELKNMRADILEAIHRPNILTATQSENDDAFQSLSVERVYGVEWTTVDNTVKHIIQNDPSQKSKTFIIRKEAHPELKHDFLYCGSSTEGSLACYVIGRELGRGAGGIASFLQNRDGESAVMKEHIGIPMPSIGDSNELSGLKKMGLLIDYYEYAQHDKTDPNNFISLQKYIPGKTLHDYLIQNNCGLFTTYKSLTEEKKVKLALALATELERVNNNGIIHGDIQPHNILIQENRSSHIKSILTNFEVSQMEPPPCLNNQPSISPKYGAPELRHALSLHKAGVSQEYPYSDKSDIYSLGVIFTDSGIEPTLSTRMTLANPDERPNIQEIIVILSNRLKSFEISSECDLEEESLRPSVSV